MTQRERGREKSLVSLAPEHKQAQQAILPGIQFSLSVCVLFDSWFARSFSRPAGSLTRSFIPSFACFFCVRVLRDLVRRLCSFGPFGCFVHIYAFFWGGEKSLAVVATGVVKTATVRIAILLSLSPLLPPFFSSAHFLWLAKKETSALG